MNDKFLYNKKVLKGRRQELRNNQTEAEVLLWQHLKGKGLGGFKFVRQYSVGPYILDFYCPNRRIAIELDGAQHGKEESVIYDKERTLYLIGSDITVLRFWNNDVLKYMDQVLDKILKVANPS